MLLLRLFHDSDPCPALLVLRPAVQLVGLAHILLHRSTWSATHYCYLEDLYVHHEVRKAMTCEGVRTTPWGLCHSETEP